MPFPWDSSIPVVERYQSALKAVDSNEQPGFVTLEGYLVGRLVIAALDRAGAFPTRKGLLETIANGEFDFQGVRLVYSPGRNQGTNSVFLTEIQSDGSIKSLESLRGVSN